MDASVLERATDLIKCCKVPRLCNSIEEAPLERATFGQFMHVLEATLRTVFDILAKHGAELTGYDEYNADHNVEFKSWLTLVIVEQYADDPTGLRADYQTESALLQKRIAQFFHGHELEHLLTDRGSDAVLRRLYGHYRRVLAADEWKYHPADVGGFVRLVEFLYGPLPLCQRAPELDDDTAAYILSVGITLVEFFEPSYRLMGLRLFCVLLGPRNKDVMKRTNIHRVAYSNAMKLTVKLEHEPFIEVLWRCIYQYVELEESDRKDYTQWSTVDDIMDTLLQQLMFESKLRTSQIYLLYLIKLLALDLPNYIIDELDEIQSIDKKCHLYEPVCEQLRQDCLGGFHNRRYYRWMKRIIEMLPHEAVKCQGLSRENGKYCHGVNLLFILVTFPIEPEAIHCHMKTQTSLIEFINVFKQYEKQQNKAAEKRSNASCDFIYNTKALVSISKSMLVFLTSLAPTYFPAHPELAVLGQRLAGHYADCDSIMYNCMQSVIDKLTLEN
ncbi:AGAP003068-PA-like protein [Anopheles sinensis]|uniref:AGAP003068-PA-like protein n=1 Tax=Anopheles sinensis TaxID=74873 RepID=A0A084VXC8_ANOSI|nr:AGAP003068-PA-like protein [Anopheles sinensis]